MPKEGFSIDDLLNPKPRQYQDDFAEKPLRKKTSNGVTEARRILNTLKLNDPPILLEPVCDYLGAYIITVDTIPDNPKAAGRHLGEGHIEIKRGLHKNLYRSTLAHELGHLALCHDTRSKWHEAESYKDPDPHEREAWDFAGELLIPDKILKPMFKSNPTPDRLAEIFKVSSDFLWVQLDKRKYI
jgi:Zn-dependent peptidase ImmA (M78 family)